MTNFEKMKQNNKNIPNVTLKKNLKILKQIVEIVHLYINQLKI